MFLHYPCLAFQYSPKLFQTTSFCSSTHPRNKKMFNLGKMMFSYMYCIMQEISHCYDDSVHNWCSFCYLEVVSFSTWVSDLRVGRGCWVSLHYLLQWWGDGRFEMVVGSGGMKVMCTRNGRWWHGGTDYVVRKERIEEKNKIKQTEERI